MRLLIIHIRILLNSQYQCCHDPCDSDKQWAYGLMWLISACSQYQLIYLTACCRMTTQNILLYFWMARLRTGGLGNRSSSSDRKKKFLPYPKCPDRPYDPPVVIIIIIIIITTITTIIIILLLQPGSSHDRPYDASELHSVLCLGFSSCWLQCINVFFSTTLPPCRRSSYLAFTIWICECYFWKILIKFFKGPILCNVSIFHVEARMRISCWVVYSFCPACTLWCFSTGVVLQGEGVSLTPNYRLVDKAFVFMSSGDRVVQLYSRTLDIHFSHLLRHAWTTLGLFLFDATTRDTMTQPASYLVCVRSSFPRGKVAEMQSWSLTSV